MATTDGGIARRFQSRRYAIDRAGIEARVSQFSQYAFKGATKVSALRVVVRLMDLTTLEGRDTLDKVATLARRARYPLPSAEDIGPCAAVCVYPTRIPAARKFLEGGPVKIASVATAFPSGHSFSDLKLDEVRRAMDLGADEIDMVIDRAALLAGDDSAVFDEIAAAKEATGNGRLKVILETGELGSLEAIRRASDLALAAGADFLKTSTGKIQPAATFPAALVMLHAIADHYRSTGRRVGFKPAGGVRTSKQALTWLIAVRETLGDSWLNPSLLRLGASTLLDDVLMQLEKERTGRYPAPEDVLSE